MRPLLCPVVVGRDDELRLLAASLDAACEARGGAIVLSGEAGIGKSRLARSTEELADERGMARVRRAPGCRLVGGGQDRPAGGPRSLRPGVPRSVPRQGQRLLWCPHRAPAPGRGPRGPGERRPHPRRPAPVDGASGSGRGLADEEVELRLEATGARVALARGAAAEARRAAAAVTARAEGAGLAVVAVDALETLGQAALAEGDLGGAADAFARAQVRARDGGSATQGLLALVEPLPVSLW